VAEGVDERSRVGLVALDAVCDRDRRACLAVVEDSDGGRRLAIGGGMGDGVSRRRRPAPAGARRLGTALGSFGRGVGLGRGGRRALAASGRRASHGERGVARRSVWPLDAPPLGGSLAPGVVPWPPPVGGLSAVGAGAVFTAGTVTAPTFTDGTEIAGTVATGVTIAGVFTGGVEIGGVEIGGVAISGPPRGSGSVTAGTVTPGTSTTGGDCCATAGIPPIPTATTTTVTPKHQRRQFILSPRSRAGNYSSRCVGA
jgi:hypothetical protein